MSASRTWPRVPLAGEAAALDRATLVRSLPSLAAGLVALVLLLKLAWGAGGYFPQSYLSAGTVAFAALAVILIARPPHYRLSTAALVGLASLIALAVWTGLSARWSTSPDRALELLQRDLSHLALFGLGLIAAGSGRFARQLVWAVLAVVVLVIGAGVVARLFPYMIGGDAAEISFGGYRLEYPLSYWNAFGGLAALGAVLGLGLCADESIRPPWRALIAAAVVMMALGLYLSFSRGAWVAFIAGMSLLLVLSRNRLWLLWTNLPTLVGASLAILLVQRHPELVDSPAGIARQAAAGLDFAPVLVILLLLAGASQLVLPALRLEDHVQSSLRRLAEPLALPAALLVIVAVVVLVGAGAVGSVDRFVNRQWQDFMRASTPAGAQDFARGKVFPGTGNARLTNVRGTRADVYRVALVQFAANPLVGGGAGSFEHAWYLGRRVPENLQNAHSLYLETLAELGLVGGVLLLGFVGSLAAAAIRARNRPRALRSGQAAAAAAAVGVWLVHSAFDWDWQISAFTGIALVLAAALYPDGRRVRRGQPGPGPAATQPQAAAS